MAETEYNCQVLVVGSGIAAMSFLESFVSLCPDVKIILISMTPLLKTARIIDKKGRGIEQLDIQEIVLQEGKVGHGLGGDNNTNNDNSDNSSLTTSLLTNHVNFTLVLDKVISIDAENHVVKTSKGRTISYQFICVCTGARPDLIEGDEELLLGIRDTISVQTLSSRLNNSRKVIVVGNGGIATELVHELQDCHIVWVIKDKSISSAFFDAAAGKFLFDSRQHQRAIKDTLQGQHSLSVCPDKGSSDEKKEVHSSEDTTEVTTSRRKGVLSTKYVCDTNVIESDGEGSALGPDWSFITSLRGSYEGDKTLDVEYETQVSEVLSKAAFLAKYSDKFPDECHQVFQDNFPAVVRLTNGKLVTCDLIVSATGVLPNTQVFLQDNNNKFRISDKDGGVIVNEMMETSVPDVFAAGDVCSVDWKEHQSETWHQMRLWTQARQMGYYAGHVIASKFTDCSPKIFFNFQTFTHVTYFFGFKVILLGLFNGQNLDRFQVQIRVEEGKSFIKIILKDGRVKGAIFIGETDMEETFENLIITQMDVSGIQDDLLEGVVDLDDYFD